MSNDTQTLTLTEFVLARIAEDEEVASNWLRFEVRDGIPGNYAIRARVLADVEAKRRIVALADALQADFERLAPAAEGVAVVVRERLLAPLASVYADHPDFQQGWKS